MNKWGQSHLPKDKNVETEGMKSHVFHLLKKTKDYKRKIIIKKFIVSAFSLFDFTEMNGNNIVEGSNFYKLKVNTASGRTKVSKTLSSHLINSVTKA